MLRSGHDTITESVDKLVAICPDRVAVVSRTKSPTDRGQAVCLRQATPSPTKASQSQFACRIDLLTICPSQLPAPAQVPHPHPPVLGFPIGNNHGSPAQGSCRQDYLNAQSAPQRLRWADSSDEQRRHVE